jgi:hypothetical protein
VDEVLADICEMRADHLRLAMHRLYSKGRIMGHKRAKRNTRPNTSLIQIEGVATKEDAQFYLGKVRPERKMGMRTWADYRIVFHYSVSHTFTRQRGRLQAPRSGLSGDVLPGRTETLDV